MASLSTAPGMHGGARLKGNGSDSGSDRIHTNRSVLVQSGEIDDVDVAPGREKVEKPAVKPWAHFLAGGYVAPNNE